MAVIQEGRAVAEPNVGIVVLARRVVGNYLLRRIIRAILTIYLVSTITFFLVRLVPGSPIEVYIYNLVNQYGIPYEEAKQQAASLFSLDLDAPIWRQYFDYMGGLLHGDFGKSLINVGTPVTTYVLKYLPWTLFSVGIGEILSFLLGMSIGMFMAYRRGSRLDHVMTIVASALSSIPNYLVGMMLVVFLGVQLELFSFTAMRGTLSPGVQPGFSLTFIKDALYHASLPITVYLLTTIGGWILTMRSSTESTLGEDYVTVAKARGLKERRIVTSYVGRNASLPLFTQFTISLAFVVGGSFFVEWLLNYQGIGLVLFNAIQQRDYPVLQGIFLLITISVIFANLLADLIYARLDPRIRLVGGR